MKEYESNNGKEIPLRELLIILLKNWKIIAVFTIVFVLCGGLYAFLFTTPVYRASIEVNMTIPPTVETKYGVYKFPTTTNAVFMESITSEDVFENVLQNSDFPISEEELEENTKAGINKTTGIITIKVKGNSPEEAKKLTEAVASSWLDILNSKYDEHAMESYIMDLRLRQGINNEKKGEIEALIKGTEEMLKDVQPLVSGDVINPRYEFLQGELVKHNISLVNLEYCMNRENEMLGELEDKKCDSFDFIKKWTFMDDEARVDDNPITPGKKLILAAAALLGLLTGVLAAFVKFYFKNKAAINRVRQTQS